MRVVILGFGISGKAAYALLKSKGHHIVVVDKQKLDIPEAILETQFDDYAFDLAIVSPGIRPSHDIYRRLKQHGIPSIGEMELGCLHLSKTQKVIGITGTNGKTTTTLLVTHVLQSSQQKARALGNVGIPLCEYVMNPDEEEILVVEVSSYQLETMEAKIFDLVCILNITDDHLDSYASFEEYKQTKLKIFDCVKSEEALAVVGVDFPVHSKNRVISIENDCFAIAKTITSFFGIDEEQFNMACETFSKPKHRIENIAEIQGVLFINDSKSTNPASTSYALEKIDRPTILLAGGKDKGFDYYSWNDSFQNNIKSVILFGESAKKMQSQLSCKDKIKICEDLYSAFNLAVSLSEKGDCVLLSPGCASFDQFRNYIHRGEVFADLVHKLQVRSPANV